MKRILIAGVLGVAYGYASACCSVSRSGVPVHFHDQSDIVVWNPDTKTEHFVRMAHFYSEAVKFGFIAPTPSIPVMEAVSRKAFSILAKEKPKETSIGCSGADASVGAAKKGSVDIVRSQDVGIYHAQTLESKDSAAMAKYVQDSGFVVDESVKEWVKHYVEKGWYLTIFTVTEPVEENYFEMEAIRMTFKADEPFCPYYVPMGNLPKQQGMLQAYFVSNGSYTPTLGKDGVFQKPDWHASVSGETRTQLAKELKIPESDVPLNSVITSISSEFPTGEKEDLMFRRDLFQGSTVNGTLAFMGGFFVIWAASRIVRHKRMLVSNSA